MPETPSQSTSSTGSPSSTNRLGSQSDSNESKLQSPALLEEQLKKLGWHQTQLEQEQTQIEDRLKEIESYLSIGDEVTLALKNLSDELFQKLVGTLESQISLALQDVIDHPIRFKAIPKNLRKATVLEFAIERNGNLEDARRAQGGSVHNVLSVGLRLFALASLNSSHRGFLVLDEQDCWLRPQLVPKLVEIVYRTAQELGFQVIMISHHDIRLFADNADKIYQLEPRLGTVQAVERSPEAVKIDGFTDVETNKDK